MSAGKDFHQLVALCWKNRRACKSQLTPTGLAKYVAVLNIITGRVPQRNKWNSIYGDDAGGKQNRMNELGEFQPA